jgi:sec-independent protein translocase protein TatA
LDFLGMGSGEIVLILLIALILFGPSKLAEIGKTLGKTVHDFRKAASEITTQVTKEVEDAKKETQAAAASLKTEANTTANLLKTEPQSAADSLKTGPHSPSQLSQPSQPAVQTTVQSSDK